MIGQKARNPLAQALLFAAVLSACILFLYGVSFLLLWIRGYPIQGVEMQNLIQEDLGFVKILQAVASVISFVLPALLFAYFSSGKIASYFKLDHNIDTWPFILLPMIVFSAMPLVAQLMLWNQAMELPPFLSGLENWMQSHEEGAAELTIGFMAINHWSDLLINLFIIGVIPALGEELLFRGVIQKFFGDWIGNWHVAIFISAAIFSFMHLQFYGFMPRFLIGIYLGYLFYWGKSLWYPILAHFIHNGSQVIGVYFRPDDLDLEAMQEVPNIPVAAIIFSGIVFASFLYLYYNYFAKQSRWKESG